MRKVALCALWLAACGGSHASTISIGGMLSQTGTLATIGQEQIQAAQLAIDEINAAGGVLGSDLTLINEDDGSDKTRSPTVAMDLVSRKVPAVLGGIASGSTIAASDVTIAANVVLMSGASTSPAITTLSDNDTVWRTCPSDALQGHLLAERAKAKGFTSVAVIYIPGPYGEGLANSFATNFQAVGGTVPFKQMYTEKQQSYADVLTAAYAATPAPQAIVLVAYPVDGAQIVKDYNSAFAAKQTFWFFTDATEDPSFVSAVGGSNFTFQHEGTGSPTPDTTPYKTYQAAFNTKYGKAADPGTFSPNVYDAVYLYALAMQSGGASDANTIKAHLRDVFAAGNTAIEPGQWATALATLKSGGKVSYQASSGSMGFDANGDPQTAPYGVWKVENGKISVIESSISP